MSFSYCRTLQSFASWRTDAVISPRIVGTLGIDETTRTVGEREVGHNEMARRETVFPARGLHLGRRQAGPAPPRLLTFRNQSVLRLVMRRWNKCRVHFVFLGCAPLILILILILISTIRAEAAEIMITIKIKRETQESEMHPQVQPNAIDWVGNVLPQLISIMFSR